MLLGGYVRWAHLASEVHAVVLSGHLQIFRKQGYLEKGSKSRRAAMANYDELHDILARDPLLTPMLDLVTGRLMVQGIASCAAKQTSATFSGIGAFPGDIERLIRWNPAG